MIKKKNMMRCALMGILLVAAASAQGGDVRELIEQPVRESINIRQATQKNEEQWQLDKDKLVARFEQQQQNGIQLQRQKDELRQQVESSRTRMAFKEKQLDGIQQIASQIQPFLSELTAKLRLLLSDGMPFLTAERKHRIERLENLLADPDIPISEKYRKAMEALQVEAEYGFTIEVYQEIIPVGGQTMLADIFRLGRLGLFYLTLDRKRCGFYNVAEKAWQSFSASHSHVIQTAIDIGAKRRPVELLNLPLGRMATR